MTEVDLPESFLTKFFLGSCSYGKSKYACSSPAGKYTDLNIWDKFLSNEQLISWTTCK